MSKSNHTLKTLAVGNAAAMREALENSNGLLEELAAIGEWGESAREQIAENHAALSAPPRNCDVGTAEEQEARYHATGNVYHTLTLQEVLSWAQMPYEEGGAA